MPSCVLKDCNSSSRLITKNDGVTFHRFVRVEHEKSDTWIRFVQRNRNDSSWSPSEHTYICSKHFKLEDKYITKTGRIYLKDTAIPYGDPLSISEAGPSENKKKHKSAKTSKDSEDEDTKAPKPNSLKLRLIRETTARKALAHKVRQTLRQNRYLKQKIEHYKKMFDVFKVKPHVCIKCGKL